MPCRRLSGSLCVRIHRRGPSGLGWRGRRPTVHRPDQAGALRRVVMNRYGSAVAIAPRIVPGTTTKVKAFVNLFSSSFTSSEGIPHRGGRGHHAGRGLKLSLPSRPSANRVFYEQSRRYATRRKAPLARALTYLIALAVGALVLIFLAPSSAPFILISGIMIGIAIPMLDALAANYRYLRLAWYSVRYWRQRIRLSVSYLFRIKVDETYLLIHSKRWTTFGPVGGVYKVSSSAKGFLDDIGTLTDNLVPIDDASRNDLRIRIPASKLVNFVRWFESEHSRETSPWREFYEELIEPKILPLDCFPFIFHDFIRRDIRPIRYSEYAQSMELLIADIHELTPTSEQLTALQNLKRDGNSNIIWVTEDQIRRLGAMPGKVQEFTVAETAIWTL